MNTNTEVSIFEKINHLVKNSVTLKLVIITILMLLLLIPATMIQSLIQEREHLNAEVTREVSLKWSGDQQLNGPILTIPLTYEFEMENKTTTTTKYWHILPDELNMEGNIMSEILKRGMYDVVVYKSTLNISGDFQIDHQPDPQNLQVIHYDKAFLTMGISDLRGIKNQINIKWNDDNLNVEPGSKIPNIIYSGITFNLPDLSKQLAQKMQFDFSIHLLGSKNLSFVPIGATTKVNLTSSWANPSFDGNFLPETREVNDHGFKATWSILQLNRNFPQDWIGNENKQQMQESSFGVNFIIPLEDYQKSYRSTKYAVMTIALTFLIFFLVEILNKRKIHPFQYAMVGLALCLFYTLLVSISEHTDFNFAYWISTAIIVAMISLYSLSVFKKIKLSLILTTTLFGIYGFMFVTLQLTDYALIIGSIGLTIILGLTMFFTRNINWYNLNIKSE